ncbi:MAG: chemotaxis protein CheC [Pseudomonadota bacterium]
MKNPIKTRMTEVNENAARNTSEAMTKLIGRQVDVTIKRSEVINVKDVSPDIKSEDIVAGIYLPITGEAKGAALVIFPDTTAFKLCDLLMEKEQGTTRQITKMDEAALKEVGNIICGSYFTILSNKLDIKIIENIPDFSFTMFGSIMEEIIANYVLRTEKALVIEVIIDIKPLTLKGYFILLFETENIEAMLSSFEELK